MASPIHVNTGIFGLYNATLSICMGSVTQFLGLNFAGGAGRFFDCVKYLHISLVHTVKSIYVDSHLLQVYFGTSCVILFSLCWLTGVAYIGEFRYYFLLGPALEIGVLFN
ncbi:MAG: hypothetical protein MHMPM18_002355 [Marteilia pararefringens]